MQRTVPETQLAVKDFANIDWLNVVWQEKLLRFGNTKLLFFAPYCLPDLFQEYHMVMKHETYSVSGMFSGERT